jgi:hypothetical protein
MNRINAGTDANSKKRTKMHMSLYKKPVCHTGFVSHSNHIYDLIYRPLLCVAVITHRQIYSAIRRFQGWVMSLATTHWLNSASVT